MQLPRRMPVVGAAPSPSRFANEFMQPRNNRMGGTMKRLVVVLGAGIVGLLCTPSPALANASFHYATASVSTTTGALTVAFKETGLGNATGTTPISLSVASASATYQCWNNGGRHPLAGNKETVTAPVSASGSFPVSNGQTTDSISAGPPGPGAFSCPSGQTLFLTSTTYSSISLTGAAGTVSASPGTVSWTGKLPA